MSPPLPLKKSEQKMKTSEEERLTRTTKRCQTCEKEYTTKPSKLERSSFCSMKCRKTASEVKKMKAVVANAGKMELTPAQSAQIRGQIANYVKDQITIANEVVMNGKDWTPTQARVFGMLLNKVVPDLNASYVQHEHQVKNLTEMTREELEAIASGAKVIEGEYAEDAD
jgi:hypothetical protein